MRCGHVARTHGIKQQSTAPNGTSRNHEKSPSTLGKRAFCGERQQMPFIYRGARGAGRTAKQFNDLRHLCGIYAGAASPSGCSRMSRKAGSLADGQIQSPRTVKRVDAALTAQKVVAGLGVPGRRAPHSHTALDCRYDPRSQAEPCGVCLGLPCCFCVGVHPQLHSGRFAGFWWCWWAPPFG